MGVGTAVGPGVGTDVGAVAGWVGTDVGTFDGSGVGLSAAVDGEGGGGGEERRSAATAAGSRLLIFMAEFANAASFATGTGGADDAGCDADEATAAAGRAATFEAVSRRCQKKNSSKFMDSELSASALRKRSVVSKMRFRSMNEMLGRADAPK